MDHLTDKGEIVIYHAGDDTDFQIGVRIEDDTVWLTQAQMVDLFSSTKQNISLHIRNIYKEGELDQNSTVKEYLTVQTEGERRIKRKLFYYNLDVIISTGYRVKSLRGTQFRIWANRILKAYLLKGYAADQRFERIENDVYYLKKKAEEFDFHVKTTLPPHEGIFYDGEIFDAYAFVSNLLKSAKKSIIVIDNYIDESVLLLLSKRNIGVSAHIYTKHISQQLKLDLKQYNSQFEPIEIKEFSKSHDRFVIIDITDVFHLGSSLKDLGKKWFAFSKIDLDAKEMIAKLKIQ